MMIMLRCCIIYIYPECGEYFFTIGQSRTREGQYVVVLWLTTTVTLDLIWNMTTLYCVVQKL
jgi:hypothetical protein